jgi:hypothetical protein
MSGTLYTLRLKTDPILPWGCTNKKDIRKPPEFSPEFDSPDCEYVETNPWMNDALRRPNHLPYDTYQYLDIDHCVDHRLMREGIDLSAVPHEKMAKVSVRRYVHDTINHGEHGIQQLWAYERIFHLTELRGR